MSLLLSPAAAKRLNHLREKQGKAALYLRVTVDGGGCQGFEYQFSFTDNPEGDDLFTEAENSPVGVVTDQTSHDLIDGSTLDYEDKMIGAKFVVLNPKATSSCGCGTSFNIA